MFVISWALVIGAAAALVAGIYQGGLTLVFIAIGGALASAVFLAAGVLRTRPVEPATAGGLFGPDERPEDAPPASAGGRPAPAPQEPPAKRGGGGKPAGAKPAAKKAGAKRKAPASSTRKKTGARRPAAARVVAIPERGTYHEAECRFVRGRRDTDRIAKATARRRGYSPCGVCKPDV